MKQFKSGDVVRITITIEAEINSEDEFVSEEDLVNMMYDDNSYGLKSVCANDRHELLYINNNIEIDTDLDSQIGEC